MAKLNSSSLRENKDFIAKFRAVCMDGDFRGRWRDERADAVSDAQRHFDANPDHDVQIEVKQIGTMSFR